MTDHPIPVDLRRRSAADRCLYLASRLSEAGEAEPLAVALVLEFLGGEIRDTADRARQLVAERDAAGQWDKPRLDRDDWERRVLALLREVSR